MTAFDAGLTILLAALSGGAGELQERLKGEQARKAELTAELATPNGGAVVELDDKRLRDELRARLADVRGS